MGDKSEQVWLTDKMRGLNSIKRGTGQDSGVLFRKLEPLSVISDKIHNW